MNKMPKGVVFLGILFIISSLVQMTGLEYTRYQYLFQPLFGWLTLIRYVGSWALRVLGVIAGVGLLYRKNFARKIVIGISWYTILTLYWKHPYGAVVRHWEMVKNELGFTYFNFGHLNMALITTVGLCVLDFVFFVFVLWYLNRWDIKKQFD